MSEEKENFKNEVVNKVKELNNLLKGYKSKYKGLSVVLKQEEFKSVKGEKFVGGLLVEFNEKTTLREPQLTDVAILKSEAA